MSCVFLIDHIFIITLNILIEANFQIRILEDGIHFGFDQKPVFFFSEKHHYDKQIYKSYTNVQCNMPKIVR